MPAKPTYGDTEWLRIKARAMAANTSPRLVRQRIEAGWSEDNAVNFESRQIRLRREKLEKEVQNGGRFAVCKPGVRPKGLMPLTARPGLMEKCLVQSGQNKNMGLRENTQGEVISKLIEQSGENV